MAEDALTACSASRAPSAPYTTSATAHHRSNGPLSLRRRLLHLACRSCALVLTGTPPFDGPRALRPGTRLKDRHASKQIHACTSYGTSTTKSPQVLMRCAPKAPTFRESCPVFISAPGRGDVYPPSQGHSKTGCALPCVPSKAHHIGLSHQQDPPAPLGRSTPRVVCPPAWWTTTLSGAFLGTPEGCARPVKQHRLAFLCNQNHVAPTRKRAELSSASITECAPPCLKRTICTKRPIRSPSSHTPCAPCTSSEVCTLCLDGQSAPPVSHTCERVCAVALSHSWAECSFATRKVVCPLSPHRRAHQLLHRSCVPCRPSPPHMRGVPFAPHTSTRAQCPLSKFRVPKSCTLPLCASETGVATGVSKTFSPKIGFLKPHMCRVC